MALVLVCAVHWGGAKQIRAVVIEEVRLVVGGRWLVLEEVSGRGIGCMGLRWVCS